MAKNRKKVGINRRVKQPPPDLFLISCKIQGLAELLDNYSYGDRSGSEGLGFHGVSRILMELGEDLYRLSGVEGDGDD